MKRLLPLTPAIVFVGGLTLAGLLLWLLLAVAFESAYIATIAMFVIFLVALPFLAVNVYWILRMPAGGYRLRSEDMRMISLASVLESLAMGCGAGAVVLLGAGRILVAEVLLGGYAILSLWMATTISASYASRRRAILDGNMPEPLPPVVMWARERRKVLWGIPALVSLLAATFVLIKGWLIEGSILGVIGMVLLIFYARQERTV